MPNQSEDVVLVGRAEFDNIYQSLKKMRDSFQRGNEELGQFGKKTQENLDRTRKKTEEGIKSTSSLLRRMAGQLYSDFKALFSLQSVAAGMKLSSQFGGAVKESLHLNDSIRRLGGSFGLARSEFGKFQAHLSRGLGDIGASSEAAAEALEGLAGLGVKGEKSAQHLVTGAVTLAGMSGEKGNEKAVAGLLGRAIQAQGKDVNDQKAQQDMIGEVTAAVQATGKQSSEILGAMDQIFSGMSKDLRAKVTPQAMAQMAVMAATVGPNATKAMQEFMAKGKIERLPMEMQGFNIFKGGQIDFKALKKFIDSTKGRIGMDPRKSLMTAGFSEEASEGLIRMADQADTVTKNLDSLNKATRDNVDAYKRSMGFVDSFKGSINTLKGRFEELTQGVSQTATDFLQAQVGDVKGSAAVVGGAATLAALLAGGGLRGIFGSFAKGQMGKIANETLTGEKVQDVYVTNAAEIAAGMGAPGIGKAGLGMIGKAGMVAGAGALGYAAGNYIANPLLDKYTQGTTEGANGAEISGNVVERLFAKLDKLADGRLSGTHKVVVESVDPKLRVRQHPSRGSSQ